MSQMCSCQCLQAYQLGAADASAWFNAIWVEASVEAHVRHCSCADACVERGLSTWHHRKKAKAPLAAQAYEENPRRYRMHPKHSPCTHQYPPCAAATCTPAAGVEHRQDVLRHQPTSLLTACSPTPDGLSTLPPKLRNACPQQCCQQALHQAAAPAKLFEVCPLSHACRPSRQPQRSA